jgi:hypothetical protein
MFAEVIDLFSENTESVEITDHGVFRGKEGLKRMYQRNDRHETPGLDVFPGDAGARCHRSSSGMVKPLRAGGILRL